MPEKTKNKLKCTFCSHDQDQVKKLIAGPGVHICNTCVDSFSADARARQANAKSEKQLVLGTAKKCLFCAQTPGQAKVCSNKNGTICFPCLDICNEILVEEHFDQVARPRLTEELVSGMPLLPKSGAGRLKCSFCRKSQDEVQKLIAGPGVYICNECYLLCKSTFEEEPQIKRPLPPGGAGVAVTGLVTSNDTSTLKKGDLVVCQVKKEHNGDYQVLVLTGGPEAYLKTSAKLLPDSITIARYEGTEQDKIVLTDTISDHIES